MNKAPQRKGSDKKFFVDEKFASEFKPEELHEYEVVFRSIDKNSDGHIDKNELQYAFHCLGYRDMGEKEVVELIKSVDLNKNNMVEYNEFLLLMKQFKSSGVADKLTKFVSKEGKEQYKISGGSGMSYSTFSEEEKSAYVRVINSVLQNDADCKSLLPISTEDLSLFTALKNGVILCKLVNVASPGTIDERVMNKGLNMNVFLCTENLRLALNSAKSIGVRVVGVDYSTILDQRYPLILGVVWQVVKIILLSKINLKSFPQLIKLLRDGEEIGDLLKMNPEEILKRWFNYHLKNANHPNPLNNWSGDLKDSTKYTVLLNQLSPNQCDLSALNENDLGKRGQQVLNNAKKLGAESYITPSDIVAGNERLNLLFSAEIFNNCHGLGELDESEWEKVKMLDDDVEGTREERAFRMWINSLNIDDVYINNLYEDLRNGLVLLKVIDKLKPGIVNWKVVDQNPKNRFAEAANCNEAIRSCKVFPIRIVSTAGRDINEPNRKLVLGVVWQLMREHVLQVLGNKTEDDVLKWTCSQTGLDLKSFSDTRFKNSLPFIDVENKIEPRNIDWDLIKKDDDSDETLKQNAKYAISVARKLGATLFLVWEDITECKPKMIMTLCAGLYNVSMTYKKPS